MEIKANKPVSPLSVMAQHHRYMEYSKGVKGQAGIQGITLEQQTVARIVQEASESVLRNLGNILSV